MILAGLAYRDVGQPRFFSFFRKSRDCRFRLHKGRKPRLSLRSRDNSVREPNAQPALATGLFTGFGVRPQRAKMDFQRSRWKSILSICGNKCTARQVAHPRKTPCPHSFVLWQAAVWQEGFGGDPGWAYRRRTGRRSQAGAVLAAALGHQHHFYFPSSGAGGVLHKIAGNGEVSVAPGSLRHAGRIEKIKHRGRNQAA